MFRKMALSSLMVSAILLSGCAGVILPGASAQPAPQVLPTASPKDRLVAAIELNDCVLTAENVGAVMARANLTQAQLTELTPQLQAEGRVEVAGSGAIRLLSENCI